MLFNEHSFSCMLMINDPFATGDEKYNTFHGTGWLLRDNFIASSYAKMIFTVNLTFCPRLQVCAIHNNNKGTQSARDTLERQFHNIPGADEKLMSFDIHALVCHTICMIRAHIKLPIWEFRWQYKCRVHREQKFHLFNGSTHGKLNKKRMLIFLVSSLGAKNEQNVCIEINYSPCRVQLAAERTSANLLRHTGALLLQTTELLEHFDQ